MTDSLKPLVSVGIPVYNAESYLIDTLESVYKQSYRNIELILYNDASVDNSAEIAAKWLANRQSRFINVKFIDASVNKGIGYASVELLKNISGIYFQLLGHDDLLYQDKISSQVNILDKNPHCALVYGNMDRINEYGEKLDEDYFTYQKFSTFNLSNPPSGDVLTELIHENFIPASSVLLRRRMVDDVGGYDATLKAEDWDLWLRICKRYKIYGSKVTYGAYRILATSAMRSSKKKIDVLESLNTALIKHKGTSKRINEIINEHLYRNTIEMYRLGHISKKWSRELPGYKTGIKPIVYYLLMNLGIKVNQKQ